MCAVQYVTDLPVLRGWSQVLLRITRTGCHSRALAPLRAEARFDQAKRSILILVNMELPHYEFLLYPPQDCAEAVVQGLQRATLERLRSLRLETIMVKVVPASDTFALPVQQARILAALRQMCLEGRIDGLSPRYCIAVSVQGFIRPAVIQKLLDTNAPDWRVRNVTQTE